MRRYGATTKKPDAIVVVAPHGRVSQYWTRNSTAEANALTRTGTSLPDLPAVLSVEVQTLE